MKCWRKGNLEELPEELLKGTTPEEERESWGRIHTQDCEHNQPPCQAKHGRQEVRR